jgi:transcriptional regulator with GAF, ATPase, and Fis domain
VTLTATHNDTERPVTNVEPSANYRPGQRRFRVRKSVEHTIAHGVKSMLRSVAQRDDFDVPNLTQLAHLSDDLEAALFVAVTNLRAQGHSWAAIAKALGVTRQTAHERFTRHGAR